MVGLLHKTTFFMTASTDLTNTGRIEPSLISIEKHTPCSDGSTRNAARMVPIRGREDFSEPLALLVIVSISSQFWT